MKFLGLYPADTVVFMAAVTVTGTLALCRGLDLGCGTGTLCCAFAQRGNRGRSSESMLAIAASKPHGEKVEWIQSRAQDYRRKKRS